MSPQFPNDTTRDRRHPKEHVGCAECGADQDTWEQKRRLPQIGPTYECSECGHEVFVYANQGRDGIIRQWRPVTDSMVVNLLFFVEVGDWPNSALEDLLKQGLERAQAIDYHMVEREGLSQIEWARRVGKTQQTVATNIRKGKQFLETEE